MKGDWETFPYPIAILSDRDDVTTQEVAIEIQEVDARWLFDYGQVFLRVSLGVKTKNGEVLYHVSGYQANSFHLVLLNLSLRVRDSMSAHSLYCTINDIIAMEVYEGGKPVL